MTARRVHAVLAAGVQNPCLITRWQEDPKFLLSQGIKPKSLDLVALRKFAGLTVKVRHNGIRREFPLTFRFMSLAGIENEVFASYATSCAAHGRPYAATSMERARNLITFLEEWLDFARMEYAILWDLIRHEHALASLASHPDSAFADAVPGTLVHWSKIRGSDVPKAFGQIIVHEMRCSPRAVEELLFQHPPRLNQISLGCYYYCYWRVGSTTGLQILELDEFGYYMLSFIDGIRSVAELNSLLGGNGRPNRAFLRALHELAAVGVVTLMR